MVESLERKDIGVKGWSKGDIDVMARDTITTMVNGGGWSRGLEKEGSINSGIRSKFNLDTNLIYFILIF